MQHGQATVLTVKHVGVGVKTRKRKEITIETERLVVVTGRKVSIVSWCRECNQRVKMVTVDEAATIAGASSRTVYRWADAGIFHFTETSEGRLLICFESIPAGSLPGSSPSLDQ